MVQLSYLWWMCIGCCARREARQDGFSSAGPDRVADELFDVVLCLGERCAAAKSDQAGVRFKKKSWRLVQVRRMYRRLGDRISSLDWVNQNNLH